QVRNRANQAKTSAQTGLATAQASLVTHIGGAALDEEVLLAAVNERREVLKASALDCVDAESDFLEDVTLEAGQTGITLATAITETDALVAMVTDLSKLDELRSS